MEIITNKLHSYQNRNECCYCIVLYCIALHCIILYYIVLYYIALHHITLHYTTLHYTGWAKNRLSFESLYNSCIC